jgi:ADP-ribose pyrophosphatase YjhB (NUDIX family)
MSDGDRRNFQIDGAVAGRVQCVARCHLTAGETVWDFGNHHSTAIEAHWKAAKANNPGYFNGRVFMLTEGEVAKDQFSGVLMAVDFKDFIWWRENPALDTRVRDCFGSALVVSRDNHVMLARQREGNINAGLSYLPGGFIDERDVADDGTVDIVTSVLRELAEETGLQSTDLTCAADLLVTTIGNQVSLSVVLHSDREASELKARVSEFLEADPDGELDAVMFVTKEADLNSYRVPDYARCLVRHFFAD